MNTMQKAHQYAKAHREEYCSYKEALRNGLKLAHAEARALKQEKSQMKLKVQIFDQAADSEAYAARIMAEGVQKYRSRVPLLLQDWKAENYEGRRDFRAWLK